MMNHILQIKKKRSQFQTILKISVFRQENANLSLLKDRVEKYHNLATSMSGILTKFEQRLGKLEQTILPVYQETEHLQKRQQSNNKK